MTMTMTEGAARRIAALAAEDGRPGAGLRVRIDGGGCMGFRYVMDVGCGEDGDAVVEAAGATLLVDGMSAPFVAGAVIDWVEELAGDRFEIRNPNAAASCGCGTSFSA